MVHLGCSSLTLAIMLLGSYTRLTESGLSMTEWSPLGSGLPKTDEEWLNEFDKYKVTNWVQLVHPGISHGPHKYFYR